MIETVVHLVRHGEVENPTGILYGRQPGWHLSERGRAMAEALSEWAATRDVRALHVSPLQRAQETAEPISQSTGLSITTDERLIEAGNVFEGKKFGVGDGALRNPTAWRHLWNPWRPSWGEPYVEQVARMKEAIGAARDAARGGEAICVSHQLPIWITRSAYEGRSFLHDPRRRICTLASVTSLVFRDDTFVELRYSEPAGHLLPPGAKRFAAGA